MARKKENKVVFENPLTQEKMTYIMSQHPSKTIQQVLDMAVDCLFKVEAENIQRNIARLIGNNGDNAGSGQ
ncbi:hypothetical protein EG832_04795 [bacterium]|nr:hypothetical protein [bacterium]